MAILDKTQAKHLADVIGELEERTRGELRVMIVKRSAVTGHVQPLVWSLLLSATFLAIWFIRHDLILWEQWWMWPALVIAAFVISELLSFVPTLQRWLTKAQDLRHQVWARAEVEFHREGLSDTANHTGVMLFVSLMERQAVVIADKGISEKVPPKTWDHVVETMIAGARTGKWAEHLEQALRECGAYLANHFPAEGPKRNELPNDVIFKD